MKGRYDQRTGVTDTWVGRALMQTEKVTLAGVLRDAIRDGTVRKVVSGRQLSDAADGPGIRPGRLAQRKQPRAAAREQRPLHRPDPLSKGRERLSGAGQRAAAVADSTTPARPQRHSGTLKTIPFTFLVTACSQKFSRRKSDSRHFHRRRSVAPRILYCFTAHLRMS